MKFRALSTVTVSIMVAALALAAPAYAAGKHHPKVSIAASHRSIHLGSSVVLSGKVAPNEKGHRVALQRYYSHRWHTQKTQKLSSKSRYSIRIKPAGTGTYKYRLYDAKKSGWTAGSSRSISVTVKRTAPKVSCRPLTNGGNCYEPGEFCRATDHGASGIAGNGEAITCKNNNGWRWEPR